MRQWYDARKDGLGGEFADAVDVLIERIVTNPFIFQRVRHETRRAVLTRFPYAIYFRLDGEAIVVLAVHGRQHPSRWRNRS